MKKAGQWAAWLEDIALPAAAKSNGTGCSSFNDSKTAPL